jgi:ATP-binding cassette, subfamily B, bacterial
MADNAVDPTIRARSRGTGEIVRRVLSYLKPYPGMAVATVSFAILSLALSFAFPKLTQYVIDDVIAQGRTEKLPLVIAALIGAFVLRDVFNGLRIRINNTFEQNVIYDMRRQVYAKLQRLPMNYFDQRASGDLMTRVIEDVNSVERLLIDGTEQGTVAVLAIIGVLAFLFQMNAQLAAIALVPIPSSPAAQSGTRSRRTSATACSAKPRAP